MAVREWFRLAAAAAAALGFAASANAQALAPTTAYPSQPYRSFAVPIYPPESGAAIGSDVDCEPPGLPPSGIGALPPSTHPCR